MKLPDLKKFKIIICLTVLFSQFAFGWDGNGHRIIAQIAYDQLTPVAKNKVDELTKVLDPDYPGWSRFIYGSTWADQIRSNDISAFNSWHFINFPINRDGLQGPAPATENVVWAVQRSQEVLASPKANTYEKAIFLRFFTHFVGDAHQPLHCAELYSRQFPNGDGSGNFYDIENANVNNLHAFWDQGLGLFRSFGKSYPLSNKEVLRLATKIEKDYPESYFGARTTDVDPVNWAKQSFQIAKDFVYNTPENTAPSAEYIAQGQRIVEQQLALAGYRMANVLNQIFGK